MARVGAVLLAAGASTRMGRNKLLLPVDGVPLVRRTASRLLDAGVSPLMVVTGHAPEAVHGALDGLPVRWAHNAHFTGPTSGSLHAGLRALGGDVDAAVVMLADMPHVTTAMIAEVVAVLRADSHPLAVSRYGDVLAPPLGFARALWPELLAWSGEGCGKKVVVAHQDAAAILDRPVAALQDLDTPDDYASFLSPRASDTSAP
ncbi:MAG: nucleotidyltransferase family protein [Gemmatimonadaceae bacterium]|nr:nucleotidyltransferase family protein [Gemmatimonadaceae bacterium]